VRRGLLPAVIGVLAAAAVAFLLLPLVGLVLRAPWSELRAVLSAPPVRAALRTSVTSSLAAVGLAAGLGVPLAWVLARVELPGRSLLRALTVLPMVLPPVVGGVALLLAFGRRGVVGGPLERLTGVTVPFTPAAVVLAAAFVSMPFLVVTVEAGLRGLDRRYEEVAATLGAGRGLAFRRVTVPLIAPSLAAGAALTWARALGEFGATITFAGNLPGRTQTLPLAVYLALETRPQVAVLLSLVLTAVSLATLAALRGRLLGGG
jgi:molybdate transport system permease protein